MYHGYGKLSTFPQSTTDLHQVQTKQNLGKWTKLDRNVRGERENIHDLFEYVIHNLIWWSEISVFRCNIFYLCIDLSYACTYLWTKMAHNDFQRVRMICFVLLFRVGFSIKKYFKEEDLYKDRESQIKAIEDTFAEAQKPVSVLSCLLWNENTKLLSLMWQMDSLWSLIAKIQSNHKNNRCYNCFNYHFYCHLREIICDVVHSINSFHSHLSYFPLFHSSSVDATFVNLFDFYTIFCLQKHYFISILDYKTL